MEKTRIKIDRWIFPRTNRFFYPKMYKLIYYNNGTISERQQETLKDQNIFSTLLFFPGTNRFLFLSTTDSDRT